MKAMPLLKRQKGSVSGKMESVELDSLPSSFSSKVALSLVQLSFTKPGMKTAGYTTVVPVM